MPFYPIRYLDGIAKGRKAENAGVCPEDRREEGEGAVEIRPASD
jgi:hypothetical protein